jgi:hypothetical protein
MIPPFQLKGSNLKQEIVLDTGSVIYVDESSEADDPDGSSWEKAFLTLQDGLDAAKDEESAEIWVAKGTYKPDEGKSRTKGDREASFTFTGNTKLYGGFEGTEDIRSERDEDPETNETVLSGDIGTEGFRPENSYRVVVVKNTANVVIDGFTVRDGFGDADEAPLNKGAGIYSKGSLEGHNLIIVKNEADRYGGGIYAKGDLALEATEVRKNDSDYPGGGAAVFEAEISLTNVEFENNSGVGKDEKGGGALFLESVSGQIDSSVFKDNSLPDGPSQNIGGGAVYAENSDLVVIDTKFNGNELNSARVAVGGAFGGRNGTYTFESVDFLGNSVSSGREFGGGGGAGFYDSTVELYDVLFEDNEAEWGGGGMAALSSSDVLIKSVEFYDNLSLPQNGGRVPRGGGLWIQDGKANIVDSHFEGNESIKEELGRKSDIATGGGLHIRGTSDNPSLVQKSTFVGNTSERGGGVSVSNTSLTESTFEDNKASNFAGGLHARGGKVNLFNIEIVENQTFEDPDRFTDAGNVAGLGYSAEGTVTNVLVADNESEDEIGGVAIEGGDDPALLTQVTVANNVADKNEGEEVVFFGGQAFPEIRNSIFWGGGENSDAVYITNTAIDPLFESTLVQGGVPEGAVDGGGVLDEDPLFIDPENGDFGLSDGSPAIDAGDNDHLPEDPFDLDENGITHEPLPIDLASEPRAQDATGGGFIVDMGAYETSGEVEEVPQVVFEPTSIDFGVVTDPTIKTVIIENVGNGLLKGGTEIVENSSHFTVEDSVGNFEIEPNDILEVPVVFTPKGSGEFTATLEISHNAENQTDPIEVPVEAEVEAVEITLNPSQIAFGPTAIEGARDGEPAPTDTFTVQNTGEVSLTVESVSVIKEETPFAVSEAPELPFEVAGGENRAIEVTYDPSEATGQGTVDSAAVSIESNSDFEGEPKLALSGQAEAPSAMVSVAPSDTTVQSGEPISFLQTVVNEAEEVARLNLQITSVPDFLELEASSIPGDGNSDADSLSLVLDPGSEAELKYSFQKSVDSTETLEGFIAHETNDPEAPNPLEVPVSVTVRQTQIPMSVSRSFQDPSDPSSYEIVAVPGREGTDVAETLTGEQGPEWRAFREVGANGDGEAGVEAYDGSEAFRFREGRAFWVISQNEWAFADTVGIADITTISLQDGWNAISNPLNSDLDWNALQSANDFDGALWRWNGGWVRADTLESALSGEGFYVHSDEARELDLSADAEAQLVGTQSEKSCRLRSVQFTAYSEGTRSTTVTAGIGPEGRTHRAPPAHFAEPTVSLRLLGEGGAAHVGQVASCSSADPVEFDMVLTTEARAAATIEASNIGSTGHFPSEGNDGLGMFLVNEETGGEHDLSGRRTVTVPTGKDGRVPLTLLMGSEGRVRRRVLPSETELKRNYPNPFSNQTTLEIALSEKTYLEIEVFNLLGQRVRIVEKGRQEAGTHEVDWDANGLASGTYFVRMTAGEVTETIQVTLVR